jgi:long-chain acyl-CoA synthetase
MDAHAQYLARPWVQFYEQGVPGTVDVLPESVPQAFDKATERAPKQRAVIFYGREITYGELRDAVDRLACAFAALGLNKGERVALYLVNSPQFIIAYFAALKAGATVTPISPVYTSHEVRYQLEDSGARAIVCQDVLYEKVLKSGVTLDLVIVTNIGEYLPTLKRFLGKGPLARMFSDINVGAPSIPAAPNLHWLSDLLAKYPAEPPTVTIDPRVDLAALPYTGGTTGHPKGVMLTHANIIGAQASVRAGFTRLVEGKEVILAFLPFFHIYGQVVIMLKDFARGTCSSCSPIRTPKRCSPPWSVMALPFSTVCPRYSNI